MGCHNWGEATDTCPWIKAKDATQHPTGHGAALPAEGYIVQTSRLRNPAQIQTPVQACTSSAGVGGEPSWLSQPQFKHSQGHLPSDFEYDRGRIRFQLCLTSLSYAEIS